MPYFHFGGVQKGAHKHPLWRMWSLYLCRLILYICVLTKPLGILDRTNHRRRAVDSREVRKMPCVNALKSCLLIQLFIFRHITVLWTLSGILCEFWFCSRDWQIDSGLHSSPYGKWQKITPAISISIIFTRFWVNNDMLNLWWCCVLNTHSTFMLVLLVLCFFVDAATTSLVAGGWAMSNCYFYFRW